MSISTFGRGPTPDIVRISEGKVQAVSVGWVLLPPG